MKTRIKGNKARREAIKIFEGLGFEVDVCEKTGRFIVQKDLFGIGDIICIKPNNTLIVQVTCNKPHTHGPYDLFAKKYPQFKIIQAVKIDRKGWKYYFYGINDYTISNKIDTFI
jgi:hypothetical protein